ncbi:MAG: SAM-dependent chlorinase/fluorinase [Dehalococcoidia bacterium]|nr:SAM-dependent chlorinase/fluorinase [Dehalococcoidia bacterium]
MTNIITLTTDFGTEDYYVGVMKGVVLGINPQARLVDLTHSVGPQQVAQGSFLLGAAFRYFPQGTVHLAVVDPGVGSARRALAVQAGGYYFVAPDNGLLTHVLAELGLRSTATAQAPALVDLGSGVRAVELTNPGFRLHPVSSTFHGRDIFAPAAAYLARGTPIGDLGDEVSSLHLFPFPQPGRERRGAVSGIVIHIDHFGNLVTNIRIDDLPPGPVEVHVGGRTIQGISVSYADAMTSADLALLAVAGSSGYLDIAARNGNAAVLLGVRLGQAVQVAFRRER